MTIFKGKYFNQLKNLFRLIRKVHFVRVKIVIDNKNT